VLLRLLSDAVCKWLLSSQFSIKRLLLKTSFTPADNISKVDLEESNKSGIYLPKEPTAWLRIISERLRGREAVAQRVRNSQTFKQSERSLTYSHVFIRTFSWAT
jgi:hypothetical protein